MTGRCTLTLPVILVQLAGVLVVHARSSCVWCHRLPPLPTPASRSRHGRQSCSRKRTRCCGAGKCDPGRPSQPPEPSSKPLCQRTLPNDPSDLSNCADVALAPHWSRLAPSPHCLPPAGSQGGLLLGAPHHPRPAHRRALVTGAHAATADELAGYVPGPQAGPRQDGKWGLGSGSRRSGSAGGAPTEPTSPPAARQAVPFFWLTLLRSQVGPRRSRSVGCCCRSVLTCAPAGRSSHTAQHSAA